MDYYPLVNSHIRAKGLSHISWAEVTSTPCNSELEESHINWAKVTSKSQWHTGFQGMLLYLQK